MNATFEKLAPEYEALLHQMKIAKGDQALAVAGSLLKTKAMYASVSIQTRVPIAWLMAVNYRESSGRLDTYLGDGERIIGPAAMAAHLQTHMVPHGRGPFPTWVAGAIDALDYDHVSGIEHWTWARALFEAELWNGFGYRMHGKHSPYLWAGTNIYTGGLFGSDNVYSPGAWDERLGVVPIMMALIRLDPTLQLEGGWPDGVPIPQLAPDELNGMQHGMSWLQDALNHVMGAELVVDGSYGRETRSAVKRFQARHSLTVDGIAGPLTVAALGEALKAPAATPRPLEALVAGPEPQATAAPVPTTPSQGQPLGLGAYLEAKAASYGPSDPLERIATAAMLPLYPIYDHDLALFCQGIYGYPGAVPIHFDHYDAGEDDTVCWALKRIGDVDVVVMRGSVTLDDFVDDAEAWPAADNELGCHVHMGFDEGLYKVCNELLTLTNAPRKIIVTGHSLGAARATILSAYLVHAGFPPIARVLFGEPRPGYTDLADYLKGIPCRNYRNGKGIDGDLVTGLPFSTSFMPWTNSAPFTEVWAEPENKDPWGPFSWHHIQLYCEALSSINTGTTP